MTDTPAKAALRAALVTRHVAAGKAKELRAALSRAEAHLADCQRAYNDRVAEDNALLHQGAAAVRDWALAGDGPPPAALAPAPAADAPTTAEAAQQLAHARSAVDELRQRAAGADQLAAEASEAARVAAMDVRRELLLVMAADLRARRFQFMIAAASVRALADAQLPLSGPWHPPHVPRPVLDELELAATLHDPIAGTPRGVSLAKWREWLELLLADPDADAPC